MVDFKKLSQKLEKEQQMANSNNRNSNNTRNTNRNDKPRDDRRGRQDESKMLICYHINERGDRSYWTRIGVAFQNRDGSFNVKLECVPVNGELHIREYVPMADNDSDDSEGE